MIMLKVWESEQGEEEESKREPAGSYFLLPNMKKSLVPGMC